MSAKSDEARGSGARAAGEGANTRAGARKRTSERGGQPVRHAQYMISAIAHGLTEQQLIKFVQDSGGIDIARSLATEGSICPPAVVVRTTAEKITSLRRSTAGTMLIEADQLLRPASLARPTSIGAPGVTSALGPGFTTTVQVVGENDEPITGAEVQLVGQQWTAQGMTGDDGSIELTLHGELPDTVTQIIVKPRSNYWGLWRTHPDLQEDAVNVVALRRLSEFANPGWGGQAMQFDRLPTEWDGAGVKIGLIDSGVATSHERLNRIAHGFDTANGREPSWSDDPIGHGTQCAGIIAAWSDQAEGLRGYAPQAELHACKLPPDARCSDLVAALDYCIGAGIDIACLGFGCEHGSAIVEYRIMAAKQRGMALIAAAGSTGGPVQFPAASPHVLAVGAVGRNGAFPDDSLQAAHARTAQSAGGFFVPAFSCSGPELDLCAPGVAIISCQSPDGYAMGDGTSLAAPHVAALAALVFAHHVDFQRQFAGRDVRRVERLFQILKDTAQPIGHPAQTGAGLPSAARALGLPSQWAPFHPPLAEVLKDLRSAMRLAGLGDSAAIVMEPTRGPAVVTRLPLSSNPVRSASAATGIETQVHDLKVAMQLAGLSNG
jgi:subtilisin